MQEYDVSKKQWDLQVHVALWRAKQDAPNSGKWENGLKITCTRWPLRATSGIRRSDDGWVWLGVLPGGPSEQHHSFLKPDIMALDWAVVEVSRVGGRKRQFRGTQGPCAHVSWGGRQAFQTGFPQGLVWQRACWGRSVRSIAAGLGVHAQQKHLGMFPISVIFWDSVLQLLKPLVGSYLLLNTWEGLNKLLLNKPSEFSPCSFCLVGVNLHLAAQGIPRKQGLAA